jgi:hypothetical protein
MNDVLTASLAFPSVIFTVVLGLAVTYWLFVILGAIDLDHGADGHVDLDGVAKGVLEGAAKGAAEALADAGADAAMEGHDGLASIFVSLELNRAPATVVLSFFAAFGWVISVVAMLVAQPAWAGWGLPRWLLGVLVLVVTVVTALPLTSLAVRPLGPLFAMRAAQSKKDLVGQVCVISTGRVDARFGQATLENGGAGLILDVRCETAGALRQGDRALLVSWDPDKEVFSVEPMDTLLGRRDDRRIESAAGPGVAAPAPEADVDEPPAERSRRQPR